ncbi:glycosyltransferase family 2 protein [Persicobacter psychrovividus]|uniref:Glycosyl transferase n=1 Tax=Persicobacter psychrovividus TaxID=387638 RepID=A0ABN6LFN8_9BACT|nr:glycosyl transferase [Persicobacter psychrovividus]
MKLSIITVVFNAKSLFELTHQSVICQSFQDFEYVVIDGQSTDGFVEALPNYEGIDQWISEPDKGIYDAMNKGLALAKGDYVLFLNAGDCLLSESSLQSVFDHLPPATDIIFAETMMVDDARHHLGLRSELTSRKLPQVLNKNAFAEGMVVCHQAFMPKRSLCEPYNLAYRHSADYNWCLEILSKSKQCKRFETPLVEYLVGGHSAKHLKASLKERWAIMKNHYGWMGTVKAHLFIAARTLGRKFHGQQNQW